jgi:putative endonuclease
MPGLFYFNQVETFVYILYSADFDKYYVGQTQDMANRVQRHNLGYEKFTSAYRPWQLVWQTTKPNRAEAMKLERKLKNLSKDRLKLFISKYSQAETNPR